MKTTDCVQPRRLGHTGNSNHRHADLEQLRDVFARCIAKIDHDQIRKTRAEVGQGVRGFEVADGVETTLDQFRAKHRPRPLIGIDDPYDWHSFVTSLERLGHKMTVRSWPRVKFAVRGNP